MNKIEFKEGFIFRLMYFFFCTALIFSSTDLVFADDAVTNKPMDAENDVIGQTLCRLVNNLESGIARGIATLAIFSVGVGLFLGKLNWGIAAATAAGVGVIFSAPELVNFIIGDDVNTCKDLLK